jgi:hypothetical protein
MRKAFSIFAFSLITLAEIAITGCSSGPKARETKTFAAGEKATVDRLTYSVVDTEIHTRLGSDPDPRIPQNRYFLVQVAVSNSSNEDLSIPSMTLVDDSGKTYPELADGTGVPKWLGVLRKVSPGQTEQGFVVFDAPAQHYRIRLTDDTSESDVYTDIPLSFLHEQQANDSPGTPIPTASPAPGAPKK